MNPMYLFCNQTVTLYNAWKDNGKTRYHKTVFDKSARLESKRNYQESKTGVTASTPSLLIIPQGASGKTYVDPVMFDAAANKTGLFTLRNSDKVMPGVGPDVSSADEWGDMLPSKVPGLVIIASVDPVRGLADQIVHVEAGG